jgi:hypothetical protein
LPAVRIGTIGAMSDHRVRLDDEELALVVGALRARIPGVGRARSEQLARLADRLDEGKRGNPRWLFGWDGVEKSVPLDRS